MLTVPRPRRSAEVNVAAPTPGTRYLADGGPRVIAHRGGAGLARENTLAAFDKSFAMGVRYLETDVRVTLDGECVAVHDATLTRVTGVEHRVDELTLAGIRRLGIGGDRVLRIADLLTTFDSAKFVLDLKDPRGMPTLIALLQRHDAVDRVCLAGARDRWLASARELAGPALATTLGWEATTKLVLAARSNRIPLNLPDAEFVHLPRRLGRSRVLTRRVVAVAQHIGLKVMAWNVEDATSMHEMLDIGVDGLITDRPDISRAVLIERDSWQAPRVWHSHEHIGPKVAGQHHLHMDDSAHKVSA